MGIMKRSLINRTIDDVIKFLEERGMKLPRFGYFHTDDWKKLKFEEWQEVFDLELGWDVSDFGGTDWKSCGCTLFTLRNGSIAPGLSAKYPNPYAEKMLFVGQDQELPYHFHRHKMEDIINRGGGDLMIQIYKSDAEEALDKTTLVPLTIDGQKKLYKPGEVLCLKPGSGIRVNPLDYHRFWAEKAPVMAWEVSKTNDDHTDNRFLEVRDRFSKVDEDEPARYILCNEYQNFLPVHKSA